MSIKEVNICVAKRLTRELQRECLKKWQMCALQRDKHVGCKENVWKRANMCVARMSEKEGNVSGNRCKHESCKKANRGVAKRISEKVANMCAAERQTLELQRDCLKRRQI